MKLILTSELGNNQKPIFRFCRNDAIIENCSIELIFETNTVSVKELRNAIHENSYPSAGINIMSINKNLNKNTNGVIPYRVLKKKKMMVK